MEPSKGREESLDKDQTLGNICNLEELAEERAAVKRCGLGIFSASLPFLLDYQEAQN